MTTLHATNDDEFPKGPVRAIGVQSRSITGTMPDGNRYESSLERDFMFLLQFDTSVDVYTPQPLTMKYRGLDGAVHKYTPDGLIEWRADRHVDDPRPLLVEIKYRESFLGEWRHWRKLARAAQDYANHRGWNFRIFTEKDIRTPILDNVRFLLPYRKRASTAETEQWVLDFLHELVESTPETLISLLYSDKWNQAALLPVVWKLMAERRIGFHIDQPLSMLAPIWSSRSSS
ncbi:TnsA endonuclease N-terminal domain-containing protein [Curvibacter delicatus]|jgi:hypothetical protein|uniref:TnsA endonuclease N-terminal domain-containing protein n=1 Tax=Curvibacter delicatus TaxID=80879 RepID=UPI000A02B0F5|nr:TnsA endonuclease N-terminal domain-containing protein [Curvibacter delicatus]